MKDHNSHKANKAPNRAKRTALFAVIVGCIIVLTVVVAIFLIHHLGGI